MKYLIFGIFTLLISCVSKQEVKNISDIKYDIISELSVGSLVEGDVVKKLGSPSMRDDKKDYYTLIYNTPQTGYQRLSLNFNYSDKVLFSFLWIPLEGEKEISLEGAKSRFDGANFKKSEENINGSHVVSNILLYTDEATGVTIRYNSSNQIVEAIAKYENQPRTPATTK